MELPAYFDLSDGPDSTVVARTEVYNNCQIAIDCNPDGTVIGIEIISGEMED